MKCRNCGKEIDENAKFCVECGTKTENSYVHSDEELILSDGEIENKFQDKSDSTLKGKKKNIIVGILVVVIVVVIIVISALQSKPSDDNSLENNAYDLNYTTEDTFGNNDDITPVETEPFTANQNHSIDVEYPEGVITYGGMHKMKAKITDVKTSVDKSNNVTVQVEIEKVSQELNNKFLDSKLCFQIDVDFYDADGMIVDSTFLWFDDLPKDDPAGTKYIDTAQHWGFIDDEKIDITKIVIKEYH